MTEVFHVRDCDDGFDAETAAAFEFQALEIRTVLHEIFHLFILERSVKPCKFDGLHVFSSLHEEIGPDSIGDKIGSVEMEMLKPGGSLRHVFHGVVLELACIA